MRALAEHIKALSQKPKLVVTGCLVSRYGEELKWELPEVDLWVELGEQIYFPQILQQELGLAAFEHTVAENNCHSPRVISTSLSYSYLKISEGCPHNCNFCLIPGIRGGLQSCGVKELQKEAEYLLSSGVKELSLVAQDVTSYGKDLGRKNALQELLQEIVQIDKEFWLRLMYLYPVGITSEFLSFLATLGPKFKPYFDIPLQHAHPEILSSMGRPFARNPEKVVSTIRKHFPRASIRTTFIVGFPGETDKHFQALLDFVRETRFDHVGVFTFYPEEGTKAAERTDQVKEEVKNSRREELLNLQADISAEIMSKHVGEWQEVLIDRKDPEWPTLYQGRTWFQAPEIDGITYVGCEDCKPGDLVWAKIQESKIYDLTALT